MTGMTRITMTGMTRMTWVTRMTGMTRTCLNGWDDTVND